MISRSYRNPATFASLPPHPGSRIEGCNEVNGCLLLDTIMENSSFIAYLRVSLDKQGLSGLWLEAQQKAVASFLESHEGALLGDFTEVETGEKVLNPE